MRLRKTSFGWAALPALLVAVIMLFASAPSASTAASAPGSAATSAVTSVSPAGPNVAPSSPPVPPSVGQTTVLINNTVYPGLYRSVDTLDSGRYPEAWGTTPAYDPSTNLFYEPVQNVTESKGSVYYGGYLASISPATDSLVGLAPVGLIPEGVTFDSNNGLLYVVNYDTNNISVVDASTDAVVGSLALPAHSYVDGSVAVNNSSGHLFLASPGNDGVWDLNITNDHASLIIATSQPTDVVYDNQTGEVYTVGSSFGGDPDIEFFGPNNDTFWKAITLPAPGINPGVPAVDWKTDELYVPWGNNTSAVDLATSTLGPTLSLSTVLTVAPAATFDPDNGMVYVVTDLPTYNVTELNPATHRWVASSLPIPSTEYGGIAYSSGSGRLLIAGGLQAGSSGFVLMSSSTLQIVGLPVSTVTPSAQSYFDPSTGYLFVPLPGIGTLGNVSVIDPSTGKILAYVPAGVSPSAVWVDPKTGYGYIANFGPPPAGHVDNLTVFNAHTFVATGSIPVGREPFTLTYDPGNGYLYVGNGGTAGNGNVTVINPATNTTVANIALPGLAPGAAMYDPTTGDLYFVGQVAGELYGAVYIVASNTLVKEVDTLYDQPYGAAYDALTSTIYIEDTNGPAYVLQEFYPGSESVGGSINLYHTSLYLAWDPVNGLLYAPDKFNFTNGGFDANTVTEVNVTSGALVNLTVGEQPTGIAVDASSGEAFVSNTVSGSVMFIDPGTPAPPTYTITFQTVPTSCSITFNGVTYTNGQQVAGLAAGSYPLVAPACTGETFGSWSSTAGTVTSTSSASTSVTVSASGTITATFSATSPGPYTITFQTVPTSCSISFNGYTYTNGQQASGVATGSYPLVALVCSGETFSSWTSSAGTVASATSASTTVTVSATGTITATFTSTPPPTYTITFQTVPTTCSVTFNGATYTNGQQTSGVAAGSYPLVAPACTGDTFSSWSSTAGNVASPTSPMTTITVAATGTVTATFTATPPGTYLVTFTETGLPTGTAWSVTLAGTLLSSSTAAISVARANGSYPFTVGTVTGYTSNVTSGTVKVQGSNQVVEIGFTSQSGSSPVGGSSSGLPAADLYLITGLLLLGLLIIMILLLLRRRKNPLVFVESGLPGGTRWSVTLPGNNIVESSTGKEIEFLVPNGTYTFRVESVPGYAATPSSGEIEVQGKRPEVPVRFAPTAPKS